MSLEMDDGLELPTSNWTDIPGFLAAFVRNPSSVSSIWPTSRFVINHICTKISESAKTIVELGPGTGGLAKALLRNGKLTEDARMILIERDKGLARRLQTSLGKDERVAVFNDDAQNLPHILQECDVERVDHALLSIPLSNMKQSVRERILHACHDTLADDGSLIAYLCRRINKRYVGDVFPHTTSKLILRNFPPMHVIEGRKIVTP